MRIFILLALFISTGTYAVEYPYLYRSAYFLGRGDTGIAIAEGADAVFYNPAGLSKGEGIFRSVPVLSPMFEVSSQTRDVIKRISAQEADPTNTLKEQLGVAQHIGLNNFSGIILRRAAIGTFVHSSNTVMIYKDHMKGALESVIAESITDYGLVFALAQDFYENFSLGITTKIFTRNQAFFNANATDSSKLSSLEDSDHIYMAGSGTGADLGATYEKKGRTRFVAAATIQDIGNTTLIPDKETQLSQSERPLKNLRQTINIGLAIEAGTSNSKFLLLCDFRDILSNISSDFGKRMHVGAELNLKNSIGFTAGINQGYPSFGSYLDLRFVRLDLGTYTEEVGTVAGSRPDARYFFRIYAGI